MEYRLTQNLLLYFEELFSIIEIEQHFLAFCLCLISATAHFPAQGHAGQRLKTHLSAGTYPKCVILLIYGPT